MGIRSQPRKDLAASFHRLRRMVIDVKSARKSLVAHHSLVAELVSVALYSSSKGPLQQDDLQEERPLAALPSNPPARSTCSPTQSDGLREVSTETQCSLPCSFSPSKPLPNPSCSSLRPLTLKISASFLTSPGKNGEISRISASHEEAESNCSKILTSATYPGKRLSQPAFWASLFLVFIYFFLYMGKEIAVFVAISSYIILWLTHRLKIAERHCSDNSGLVDSVCYDEDHHAQEILGLNLSRSSTIPMGSDSQQAIVRSQSCPTLYGSLQDEVCLKERELALYPQFSVATSEASKSFSSRVKLGMILVLALCGLTYSHFAAVCLCSCCIFVLSVTKKMMMKRYRLN